MQFLDQRTCISHDQCDQIWHFLKALGENFFCKVAQIFDDILGYFEKISPFRPKLVCLLLGNFWEVLVTLVTIEMIDWYQSEVKEFFLQGEIKFLHNVFYDADLPSSNEYFLQLPDAFAIRYWKGGWKNGKSKCKCKMSIFKVEKY